MVRGTLWPDATFHFEGASPAAFPRFTRHAHAFPADPAPGFFQTGDQHQLLEQPLDIGMFRMLPFNDALSRQFIDDSDPWLSRFHPRFNEIAHGIFLEIAINNVNHYY